MYCFALILYTHFLHVVRVRQKGGGGFIIKMGVYYQGNLILILVIVDIVLGLGVLTYTRLYQAGSIVHGSCCLWHKMSLLLLLLHHYGVCGYLESGCPKSGKMQA